ncbi:multidrug effflux MFS transporter [Parafrankia sp. EUN1f]|uniref:multidrug effflux MFS transporter n=1 Tax=Parafrankia sp. EUN1f TaxID=102897 RepID=UPI0012FC5ADA|nr:multidrug effflux MFS transporter [Parafrankia sp. EUN1f]
MQSSVSGRVLIVLGALSAFGPLATDLYLPALPELADDLGATDSAAQLTVTACLVGLALGQLVVGPVSDRFGRRRPLIIGVGAFAVMSALCALAPGMGALTGLRLLQGFAGGAGVVIARAVVRDLFGTAAVARVLSLLLLVSGTAPVLAPVIGAQLLHLTSWRGLFAVLTLVGCLLLTAATFTIRESLPAADRIPGGPAGSLRQITLVLRDGYSLCFILVVACTGGLLFAYIAMSPFVFQDGYGMSAQAYSAVFATNAVGMVLAGRLNVLLLRRIGTVRSLRVGLTTALAGATALTVVTALDLPLVLVLVLLFLTVPPLGMIFPNATALALDAHASRAGAASGLTGVAQFGVGGTIAPVVAWLAGTGTVTMAATMMGSVVLAFALSRVASRHPAAGPPALPGPAQATSARQAPTRPAGMDATPPSAGVTG